MIAYLIEKQYNYKYVTKYEGGNHSLSKYLTRRRVDFCKTNNKPAKLKCFVCDDTFDIMDSLGLHERWHCDPRNEIKINENEEPPIKRITCYGCGILKPFNQFDDRYNHKAKG
eukprot:240025_1